MELSWPEQWQALGGWQGGQCGAGSMANSITGTSPGDRGNKKLSSEILLVLNHTVEAGRRGGAPLPSVWSSPIFQQ